MWRVSSVLTLSGLSQPYRLSQPAADRGTAVHAAGERLGQGHLYDQPEDSHAPFVDALQQWFADFKPTVLFTERRVTNKAMRLTGRIDLGCLLDDAALIIDYKTGSPAPSHGIQVCGYCQLADNDQSLCDLLLKHTFGPWDRGVLYLKATGKYDWRGPLRLLKDGPHDRFLWDAARALVQWRFDHGLLALTDPDNPEATA